MPGKLVDLGKRKKGKKKKKKVRGKTTVHREGHEGRSNKRVAGEQRMGSISVQDHGGIRLEMFYLLIILSFDINCSSWSNEYWDY